MRPAQLNPEGSLVAVELLVAPTVLEQLLAAERESMHP